MFYNIEANCEFDNDTNTNIVERFQMPDMLELIFPIFVIYEGMQIGYIVHYDV